MTNNVAIIGCGQVGRRHTQGLGLSLSTINLHIYDVSKISINESRNFFNSISDEISNLKIHFYDSIKEIGKASNLFDLVIVSSTAQDRPGQFTRLKSSINSNAWLLEKPICQSPYELNQMVKLTKDLNIWVNHFLRSLPGYKKIKKNYFNYQKINITFASKDIGIGCNISHFIDTVNFLTGELPIYTDTSELSKEWHDAKRQGFKEINGTLKCKFSNGSLMNVVSDNNLNKFIISGEFIDTGENFSIDVNEGIFKLNGKVIELGKFPFQSQLTGKVFDQINQKGRSDLTPFRVAADCYRPVIEGLLMHWQSTSSNNKDNFVPLT